jgi:hypothetical protein
MYQYHEGEGNILAARIDLLSSVERYKLVQDGAARLPPLRVAREGEQMESCNCVDLGFACCRALAKSHDPCPDNNTSNI